MHLSDWLEFDEPPPGNPPMPPPAETPPPACRITGRIAAVTGDVLRWLREEGDAVYAEAGGTAWQAWLENGLANVEALNEVGARLGRLKQIRPRSSPRRRPDAG